jgi:hypothetical protein
MSVVTILAPMVRREILRPTRSLPYGMKQGPLYE